MDAPLVLTREQSRSVDRIAIERFGIPGVVLMENAGRGAVDILLAVDPSLGRVHEVRQVLGVQSDRSVGFTHPTATAAATASVAILCGKGNNAGDGFVMARHLAIREVKAAVLLLAPPEELAGDALANYQILAHTGVTIVDISAAKPQAALDALLDEHAGGAAWLVDALLGTGARGEPREPFAAAIDWMNAAGGRRLAVDLPSGLDADTGRPSVHTVRADVTCTFVGLKQGFRAPAAAAFLGDTHVVPIGLTREMAARAAAAPPAQPP